MKILLLTLILLATGSAWAEWVRVDETHIASMYIDPSTIRRDGNFRKVWELQDLKQRDKTGWLSSRYRIEYDCKEERGRILSFSTHSDSMAGGDTLLLDATVRTWYDVAPNTPGETLLKIVCAK